MAPELCDRHIVFAEDMATIKQVVNNMHASFEEVKLRFVGHIQDAEKTGGRHERLLILEQEVAALKKAMWARVLVAGLIGGLIGSGSADAIALFLKWVMKS